ncbi:DUF6907 domain-containing protein [Nocardia araoensis]|uniref:DUF6907 domain-containing protein n=1 Tax=Nocardia araoensis TaxID=228600 RepID=UPI00030869E6|nr:hypothetical protein [Nocardia araoensis]
MTIPTPLTAAQFDRPTCKDCGNQRGPWVPTENFRDELGGQVFRCAPGHGCAAIINTAEFDLACSVCKKVIATVSAPLPDVPVKCQTCRRDPGCASWCPTGDGHPDELFTDDRICYGPEQVIALTIEPAPGVGLVASAEVSPVRRPGGRDSVYIAVNQRHGTTDFDATVSEARQLAAVLLQVADVVDAD